MIIANFILNGVRFDTTYASPYEIEQMNLITAWNVVENKKNVFYGYDEEIYDVLLEISRFADIVITRF